MLSSSIGMNVPPTYVAISLLGLADLAGEEDELGHVLLQALGVALKGF